MRNNLREFFYELDKQLKVRLVAHVAHMDFLFCSSTGDLYHNSIDLLIIHVKQYSILNNEEGISQIYDSNDPVAKFLMKHMKSINHDYVKAPYAGLDPTPTVTYEFHIEVQSEIQVSRMLKFIKDPEWTTYSEEFDKQINSLLSGEEV